MQQLDEIVELAASDTVRLSTILRKCLVLAARLKNNNLREWVLGELNGYDDISHLPTYRNLQITAKGFFVGPLGSTLYGQPLPSSILEDDHRWWATTAYLRESVSAYEAIVANSEGSGAVQRNWPGDLVVRYQTKFYEHYVLNRAWQEVPIGAIFALVDTVRTRLLQLALDLQASIDGTDAVTPNPEVVEQRVQTIIYGGTNFVGSVAGNVQMIGHQVVVKGDFATLVPVLNAAGVEPSHIDELKSAIEQDSTSGAENGFGSAVASWLQKAGTYIGKRGLQVGADVAKKMITQAVLGYFGIAA